MYEIYVNDQLHTRTETKPEANEVIEFLKQNGVKKIFLFEVEEGKSERR